MRRHSKLLVLFVSLAPFFLIVVVVLDDLRKPPQNFLQGRYLKQGVRSFSTIPPYSSNAALRLPRKGRLLCFVVTSSLYHGTRVPAVNETWLPRCGHGQFFTNSDIEGYGIPYSTVFTSIADSYNNLFYKSLLAFQFAYQNISSDFDWYLKADDDTYIIMEHLMEYLDTLDPNEPYYIGYRMKPHLLHGYNSGGAGYVLSRTALRIFLDEALHNTTLCPNESSEDVGIARCLQNIGIFPHDTRNPKGQQRFQSYHPASVFHGSIASKWHFYPQKTGHNWASEDLISMHYMSPDDMRIVDDLLYRVKSPTMSKYNKK